MRAAGRRQAQCQSGRGGTPNQKCQPRGSGTDGTSRCAPRRGSLSGLLNTSANAGDRCDRREELRHPLMISRIRTSRGFFTKTRSFAIFSVCTITTSARYLELTSRSSAQDPRSVDAAPACADPSRPGAHRRDARPARHDDRVSELTPRSWSDQRALARCELCPNCHERLPWFSGSFV